MRMTMAMAEAGVSVVTFDLKTFHNMASIKKACESDKKRFVLQQIHSASHAYVVRLG